MYEEAKKKRLAIPTNNVQSATARPEITVGYVALSEYFVASLKRFWLKVYLTFSISPFIFLSFSQRVFWDNVLFSEKPVFVLL